MMLRCGTHQQRQAGFTLVEVMVAMALFGILATGLYATGLMTMRVTAFNRVSLEARALGVQMLEEIASQGVANIALQAPYSEVTNRLLYGEEVVRGALVIGHDLDRAVATNLAESAYVECHVYARYVSPMTRTTVTNWFSTIAR